MFVSKERHESLHPSVGVEELETSPRYGVESTVIGDADSEQAIIREGPEHGLEPVERQACTVGDSGDWRALWTSLENLKNVSVNVDTGALLQREPQSASALLQ